MPAQPAPEAQPRAVELPADAQAALEMLFGVDISELQQLEAARHARLDSPHDSGPGAPKRRRELAPIAPGYRAACIALPDYNDAQVETFTLDGMTLQCPRCGSWNFPAETVGRPPRVTLCCKGGKTSHIPALPDAPEPLRSLLLSSTRTAREFRANIRRYNAALSFVSFGASVEVLAGRTGNAGPPVCIIHGAVYHHSHALRADSPADAKYAQLYLYDPAQAAQLREACNPGLNPEILEQLANMLTSVNNPYAQAYRQMGEVTRAPA